MKADLTEYKASWYLRNRDRILAQKRTQYANNMKDPAFRKRQNENHRKWLADPVVKAKRNEYLRGRRATPKIREKLLKEEKLWRESHRQYLKETFLKRQYGITSEEREAILSRQGGGCAICGRNSRLNIDHCHSSKRVRGILCNQCNQGVGYFRDDPLLLEKAAAYLRNHP